VLEKVGGEEDGGGARGEWRHGPIWAQRDTYAARLKSARAGTVMVLSLSLQTRTRPQREAMEQATPTGGVGVAALAAGSGLGLGRADCMMRALVICLLVDLG
jgi:hypothetical protein